MARANPISRLPVFIMGLLAGRQAEEQASDPSLKQTADCGCQPGPRSAYLWFVIWAHT